jgi:thiosulfate/3-mercaptopyruvate sulfurtransferase
MEQVKKIISTNSEQDGPPTIIVDARSPERFYAQVDEPRPGLRRGHMPGAKNLFFLTLLHPDNPTKLLPPEELQVKIQQAGIPKDVRVVTTCGSGATACTVAAALMECGHSPENVFIYDASFMEWGQADLDNPLVTTD